MVNIKELVHMPSGTVFSQIIKVDDDFHISGLNILIGNYNNNEYLSEKAGHFYNTIGRIVAIRDGADPYLNFNFDDDDYFIVYDNDQILLIIESLKKALSGCVDDLTK